MKPEPPEGGSVGWRAKTFRTCRCHGVTCPGMQTYTSPSTLQEIYGSSLYIFLKKDRYANPKAPPPPPPLPEVTRHARGVPDTSRRLSLFSPTFAAVVSSSLGFILNMCQAKRPTRRPPAGPCGKWFLLGGHDAPRPSAPVKDTYPTEFNSPS